jgi:triosephosphate isomerase (TIM)
VSKNHYLQGYFCQIRGAGYNDPMQLLVVANWKMAPEKPTEAVKLAKATRAAAVKYGKKISLVVCAPAVHVPIVAKVSTLLKVGGQSVAAAPEVAQTGFVSASMLKTAGAKFCIVGHSEERSRGQSAEQVNAMVHEQLLRVLEAGLTPIICIGEKNRDTQGWYLSEVKDQLESALSGLSRKAVEKIVFAYEPVWAIGSKAVREATPAECSEMVIYIRKIIADLFGHHTGGAVRILYGGSADEKNAQRFIVDGMAQGLLVGRVSLDSKRFTALLASLVA